ncbi:MAG: GIY-YIG nuclease family protein [Clostridium sp.]|nr:GIY-YIG nuclease family protein [Clostridium sp.]
MEEKAYTYIVECRDKTLYTGWTNRLEERLACHNQGKGAKYTRSRLPVRLVYYECFATKQEAMKREYAIKRMSRKDKLKLIQEKRERTGEVCGENETTIPEILSEYK